MWKGRFRQATSSLLRYSESVSLTGGSTARISGSIAHARALRNADFTTEEFESIESAFQIETRLTLAALFLIRA
jgi:hypothetical protein